MTRLLGAYVLTFCAAIFFRANGERMQRYFTFTARGELLLSFVLLGLF
jgi:hypothetical protein